MNRRRFLGFLAGAPIAVAAGATVHNPRDIWNFIVGIDGGGLDGAWACAMHIARAGDHVVIPPGAFARLIETRRFREDELVPFSAVYGA